MTHQRVQVSIVLLAASRFGLLKQGLLHIEARNTAPLPFLVVAQGHPVPHLRLILVFLAIKNRHNLVLTSIVGVFFCWSESGDLILTDTSTLLQKTKTVKFGRCL